MRTYRARQERFVAVDFEFVAAHFEIMETMTRGKFRHLPVVEDSRVVGLISIGDVVKWRVGEYEREQEALRDYIKTA